MTGEDQLLGEVLGIVEDLGLRYHHDPDSRRSGSPGFPDLVIAGPGGVYAVELKSRGRALEPEQRWWSSRLAAAGMTFTVWRPRDLRDDTIRRMLEKIAAPM